MVYRTVLSKCNGVEFVHRATTVHGTAVSVMRVAVGALLIARYDGIYLVRWTASNTVTDYSI